MGWRLIPNNLKARTGCLVARAAEKAEHSFPHFNSMDDRNGECPTGTKKQPTFKHRMPDRGEKTASVMVGCVQRLMIRLWIPARVTKGRVRDSDLAGEAHVKALYARKGRKGCVCDRPAFAHSQPPQPHKVHQISMHHRVASFSTFFLTRSLPSESCPAKPHIARPGRQIAAQAQNCRESPSSGRPRGVPPWRLWRPCMWRAGAFRQ